MSWDSGPMNPSVFRRSIFEYDAPAVITNAIIDSNADSDHDWKAIFEQLEELGCLDIQLRFYNTVSRKEMERILGLLERRAIKSVDIVVKYSRQWTKRFLVKFTERFFRVKTITLHTAPKDEVYRMFGGKDRNGMGNILFVKQEITSNTHCGAISPMYFTFSNMRLFSEAKNFNSCLNRKVGIDVDGAIKNCPSLEPSYGNVKDTSIHSAVTNIHFQELWQVNKDQIEICKACEFRYVCTDCRAFIADSDDKYSKPSKCKYNPYTTKWEA
jgi:SPASM domain peptide maturase of grasp-with-spasm system